MSQNDAFALKRLGVDEFLHAYVGTETRGSPLTVLSVLGRLGQDPWAEAARWTKLPASLVIEQLAANIVLMPLSPESRANARATAEALVGLLPAHSRKSPMQEDRGVQPSLTKRRSRIAILYFALAFGFMVNMVLTQKPSGTPEPAATEQMPAHAP